MMQVLSTRSLIRIGMILLMSAACPGDRDPRAEDVPDDEARWLVANDGPPIPVIEATVAVKHGWTALVGGLTSSLETTHVIQLRHPERGWQPIGSRMLDARAGHTATLLDDGRLFIAGGVQGVAGSELRALRSTELLDPIIAGNQQGPELDTPLSGHTAHALAGNRAAIVGGEAVRIFDGDDNSWVDRVDLLAARRFHTSVRLKGGDLLVIGGDDTGSIEFIDLPRRTSGPAAKSAGPSAPWFDGLGAPISKCRAIELPDGRVFVVGGVNAETGESISSTWLLTPRHFLVNAGPVLPIEGGIAGVSLFLDGERVVIVGGESIKASERTPSKEAFVFDIATGSIHRLPQLPNAATRRNWYQTAEGDIAAIGGYRFVGPQEAEEIGVRPGAYLSPIEVRLQWLDAETVSSR